NHPKGRPVWPAPTGPRQAGVPAQRAVLVVPESSQTLRAERPAPSGIGWPRNVGSCPSTQDSLRRPESLRSVRVPCHISGMSRAPSASLRGASGRCAQHSLKLLRLWKVSAACCPGTLQDAVEISSNSSLRRSNTSGLRTHTFPQRDSEQRPFPPHGPSLWVPPAHAIAE